MSAYLVHLSHCLFILTNEKMLAWSRDSRFVPSGILHPWETKPMLAPQFLRHLDHKFAKSEAQLPWLTTGHHVAGSEQVLGLPLEFSIFNKVTADDRLKNSVLETGEWHYEYHVYLSHSLWLAQSVSLALDQGRSEALASWCKSSKVVKTLS